MGSLMVFPAASSASDVRLPLAAGCSMQWARAFGKPMATVVSNSKGLFITLGLGMGIVLLIGYTFLHWTKWKTPILTGLAAIVIVAVALIVWPSFFHSITKTIC